MSKPITVEQLAKFCQAQIRKGNGKRFIAITDDDECNGVHSCWFGFSNIIDFKDVCYNYTEKELKQYILLG